jgi:hypothetical protein
VAEHVLGVNPDVQAALLGGISGGVVGGVLGVLGALLGVAWERALERRGKVRCRIIRSLASYSGVDSWPGHRVSVGIPEQLDGVQDVHLHYDFRVGFFNERDVDSGLTDIRGAILGPDGRDFVRLRGSVYGSDRTIDLPARKWVYFALKNSDDTVSADRIEDAKRCDRVQVRATWPDGRPYESEPMRFEIESYFPGESGYLDHG